MDDQMITFFDKLNSATNEDQMAKAWQFLLDQGLDLTTGDWYATNANLMIEQGLCTISREI